MANELLKAALQYQKHGLSIFPCNPYPDKEDGDRIFKNKQPYLSFVPYRDRLPTEKEITSWWTKWPTAMIGCITGKKPNNILIIEIDSEKGYQGIQEHISDNYTTRIAKSPKGYHVYFKHFEGPKNSSRIMESIIPDVDCRTDGGYIIMPPSINLRNGNGKGEPYKWLLDAKVNIIPSSLKDIILSTLTSTYREGVVRSRQRSSEVVMFKDGRRDEDLFHTANCLVKGFMPENEIRQVLEKLIISWGEAPSKGWINAKVESALSREDLRGKSLAEEVREFVMSSFGVIKSSDCLHLSSGVVNKGDRKNISKIFSRLCDEGLIERHGNRNGQFRKIENDFKSIQLDSLEDGSLFDIKLPFGMEQYLEVMPKDLIVFAGVPNAGKTALMLETCRLNMRGHKCFYFSSEMGAHNCKRRLAKHETCEDWPFEFVDDFPNFIDIIQPDNINFIDYIEETEGEAYKIPGILAKIQRKLKNGIAIVALQKNPKVAHAIGGYQTMAKPSLFCSIDPDFPGAILRIVKAKNYKDENPNGFILNFKIVKGINLIPEGVFMPEV